jgi:DNA-binding MarR family transcriptional regulator
MFEHCLYFNTTSLARHLEREWTKAFQPFGLTPPQAFMLRVILAKAPITHTDLAAELNISKATGSRTVEGLERLGFVKRAPAGEDGRSSVLSPTPSARAIGDALNQASGDMTRRIKRAIGAETFDGVVASLRGIGATLR